MILDMLASRKDEDARPGCSHAALGDQLDRLELELSAECPSSLHKPPPVSSSTLTRGFETGSSSHGFDVAMASGHN